LKSDEYVTIYSQKLEDGKIILLYCHFCHEEPTGILFTFGVDKHKKINP